MKRIDSWFFAFRWGMNDKTDLHILVWRASPPYNVHVGFVIHTNNEMKKSTFNS